MIDTRTNTPPVRVFDGTRGGTELKGGGKRRKKNPLQISVLSVTAKSGSVLVGSKYSEVPKKSNGVLSILSLGEL